jgi:hypothetical protein
MKISEKDAKMQTRQLSRSGDPSPLHARIGYPPGQNYEVLQVALEETLRVQWEWCIEQALADYPVEL